MLSEDGYVAFWNENPQSLSFNKYQKTLAFQYLSSSVFSHLANSERSVSVSLQCFFLNLDEIFSCKKTCLDHRGGDSSRARLTVGVQSVVNKMAASHPVRRPTNSQKFDVFVFGVFFEKKKDEWKHRKDFYFLIIFFLMSMLRSVSCTQHEWCSVSLSTVTVCLYTLFYICLGGSKPLKAVRSNTF